MSSGIALRLIQSFRGKASTDETILTNRSCGSHARAQHLPQMEVQNQLQLMRKTTEMGLL